MKPPAIALATAPHLCEVLRKTATEGGRSVTRDRHVMMIRPPSAFCRFWITCLLVAALGHLAGCAALRPGPDQEIDTLLDVRQITAGYTDAADGVFSPDMQWLVFRAIPREEETAQLFIARVLREQGPAASGEIVGIGQPIRLTPRGSRNASPAFSPDGHTLLFTSTAGAAEDPLRKRPGASALDYDAQAEIFRVDGWQRNIAAADPRQGVNFAKRPVSPHAGFDGEPTFTPDGQYVIFASDRDAPESAVETRSLVDLYAMRPDGSEIVRLTNQQGYDGKPTVSPDGRMVFFQSDRAQAEAFDLYALELLYDEGGRIIAASPARRMTTDGSSTDPSFHPEGDVVAYVSARDDERRVGNREIRQMQPTGERDYRITFTPAADETPRFSPDGRYLLFSSRRTPDGSRQLFLARYRRP